MSDLGRRARAALPAVGLLTLVAAAALSLTVVIGFAPTPPPVQAGLALLTAALLGAAVAGQVRAALDAWRAATAAEAGVHRRGRRAVRPTTGARIDPDGPSAAPLADAPPQRPRIDPPSWRRSVAVAAAVATLVLLLWVRPGPVGDWATAVGRFLVGYVVFAVPVLPLLLLRPLPRPARAPYPWQIPLEPLVDRRLWTRDELAVLGRSSLVWLRERLFTKATGVVVAAVGLLHLVRGTPDLTDGGTSRAGGVAGFLLAEPLRLLFASAGAVGLLVAVLACAVAVIAGHLSRHVGTAYAYAALAAGLVVPLLGIAAGHWLGFEYYLKTDGSRVVIVAGLSPGHRHATHDTSLTVDGLAPSLRGLFVAGLPVAGVDDGIRIAKALAQPAGSAAPVFVGDQYELKTGECFDWIGGSTQLRYVAPCNGAHIGEVYFVGHLPFKVDPGRPAVEAASRAMCEQSYGDYLGVPYGQSYLAMEAPLMPAPVLTGGWAERPVIACWLSAVGPWALKGTRTVAALHQKTPWETAVGCKVEVPDVLRVTAEAANARCVVPGPKQKLAVEGGGFVIDLEFPAIGKDAGAARPGAGCYDGADLGSGYSFEVAGDGTLEIYKHAAGQHTRLSVSAKPKGAAGPAAASTPMQVSCVVKPGQGVELVANSTGSRRVVVTDATAPIVRLSPRLVFTTAEVAPAVMSAVIFSAVRV